MRILSNIRELIWPMLEPEIPEQTQNSISDDDFSIDTEDVDTALDLAKDFYNSEKERNLHVESKSTIFIGAFGLTITIILFAVKDIISSSKPINNGISIFTTIGFALITIYISRTLIYSIKVLQRKGFHTVKYMDIINPASGMEFKKHIIATLIDSTRKNYITTNLKVDYMTMAQENFIRAIYIIILYAVLICGYIISEGNTTVLRKASKAIIDIYQTHINSWVLPALFFLNIVIIVWLTIVTIWLKRAYSRYREDKSD